MARQRIIVLTAASAVFALCSLASMPAAAEAIKQHALQLDPMEQSVDVFSVYDLGEVTAAMASPERLPESPGGVIAKVTVSTAITTNEKEVLPGGAAGVASIGIRGPTTS
ncbi:hypothetical protein BKP64_10855 [Marinobacter salinus]|uniref:TonB-dependent receptor n=1 Tax=Marinobacter salinus TaxID=1874317 RepID=A0A1D9GLW2_9GAMM|nr:hypothetical protein [Marinobacter salinus]AOY88627.1 hypothetical protein BKP64_10855 [Marinobacter salinus]